MSTPDSAVRVPPQVRCHGCGWTVPLPFIDAEHVSIEPVEGWEIGVGAVLCERCSKGWEPEPRPGRLRVQWADRAVDGALSALLDYRDGNISGIGPNSQALAVAIDTLRATGANPAGRAEGVGRE